MSIIFFEEEYDRATSIFTESNPIQTIRDSACGQIKAQANLVFGAMKAVQNTINAAERVAQAFLASMSWSPKSYVKALANKALKDALKMIPKVPKEWDEVVRIMNACNFINSTSLTEPSVLASSLQSEMTKQAKKSIKNITDELPEFSAANLINLIKGQLKTAQFKINLDNYQKAIACMSAVCHVDVRPRVAELNAFLKRIYMTGSGELNIVALLKGCGITDVDHIIGLSAALALFEEIDDAVTASVTEGKEFLNTYF